MISALAVAASLAVSSIENNFVFKVEARLRKADLDDFRKEKMRELWSAATQNKILDEEMLQEFRKYHIKEYSKEAYERELAQARERDRKKPNYKELTEARKRRKRGCCVVS